MVEPAEPPQQPRIAGGRAGRVAPLLGLAGRTAGEAVVASLRNRRRGATDDQGGLEFHNRTAARYADRLGRSRGVLMKAGQILSVALPESAVHTDYRGIYQAAFAKLQDDAPPMPAELAIEVLTAELGRPPSEVFAKFDPHPLAAASIGQVHAATLPGGRRVAVKVQYPGVDKAIRADLANTELLATFLRLLFAVVPNLTRTDVRELAREVSDRIGEEIDYRVEAANQQAFADAYRGHPFIRIPEILPELSTRRVLSMELVDGLRYSKAARAEQQLRDSWGEVVFRFFGDSLYRLGLMNTDPHPGNYLFHPDGTVSFLDFGCVKRFTDAQARTMSGFLQRTVDQDPHRLYEWGIESGWIAPPDAPTPAELLDYWSAGCRYLLPPQPFTFTGEYAVEVMRSRLSSQVVHKLAVPGDYTFVVRMDAGLAAILGGLRATGHWQAIREEWDRATHPATPLGELDFAFWAAPR